MHRPIYQLGSNQWRKQQKRQRHNLKPKTWATIGIIVLMVAIPEVGFFTNAQLAKKFDALKRSVSLSAYAYEKDEPIVKDPSAEQKEIIDYIYEVFGDDADKAFRVLGCENHSLNPKAVNTAGNVPEGSRDIGIFQINEYWQGVNGKFLFDWKINIQIAHKIYVDNGYSFERWSCGRRLGV